MSYLDRLKQKISQDMPRGGATKATEGAFVPFVATRSAPSRQNLVMEARDWQPTDGELSEAIREAYEERAAIREYCGNEPREKAEDEARKALRVYEYRLSDYGDNGPWLIFLAPGCDLSQAEQALKNRFGSDRVLTVRERTCGQEKKKY